MASPKSPFMVFQEFLSPKLCEEIVIDLNFFTPNFDAEGDPAMLMRSHEASEHLVYKKFENLIPQIEQYYEFEHRGTETVMFEFYAEETKPYLHCESSDWIRKKWVRTRDRDLTCLVFFSTYQDQVPFDNDYEVYGGKIEFPQHGFGFNPERGTMIVFPSGPHFINTASHIIAGELVMARFHLAATMPYLYNPNNFPGDYRSWFSGLY